MMDDDGFQSVRVKSAAGRSLEALTRATQCSCHDDWLFTSKLQPCCSVLGNCTTVFCAPSCHTICKGEAVELSLIACQCCRRTVAAARLQHPAAASCL